MEEPRDNLQLKEGVVEVVRESCYLGDLLDSEGRVERAVRIRVPAGRHKWSDICSLLTKNKPAIEKQNPSLRCVFEISIAVWL